MIFVVDLAINQIANLINYLMINQSLKIKLNFNKIDNNMKKEISSYSFFVFLGIITDQIFWKTDGIILGILSNITVVGVYSISSQLVNQFMNLSSTFSGVFLPRLTEMVARGESKKTINEFFTKASRFQFILVAMILINYIFLGKQFINLWVGSKMQDAYYYGLVIVISLTVPMFQTTGYQILYAMNKHKVRSIIYLFNAIFNIIMSIILFKVYGAFGPALATAIAMVIGNTIVINIYYKKVLELKLVKFFRQVCFKTGIVAIIVAMIFIGLNKIIISKGIYSFLVKAVISNAVYLIGIFLYALSKEERNKVLKKFRLK
jgi:O-antigen/teichoic acid export membrane protein